MGVVTVIDGGAFVCRDIHRENRRDVSIILIGNAHGSPYETISMKMSIVRRSKYDQRICMSVANLILPESMDRATLQVCGCYVDNMRTEVMLWFCKSTPDGSATRHSKCDPPNMIVAKGLEVR